MDYSLPGSSVHGYSPGKNTGVGCHTLLQGIFPTQGSNPGLPHCIAFIIIIRVTGLPWGQSQEEEGPTPADSLCPKLWTMLVLWVCFRGSVRRTRCFRVGPKLAPCDTIIFMLFRLYNKTAWLSPPAEPDFHEYTLLCGQSRYSEG